MDTRDNITNELLGGATPAQLARKYPRKSVYRIYSELVQSGQIGDAEIIRAEDLGDESAPEYPFKPAASQSQAQPQTIVVEKEEATGKTGAEVLDFTGPKGLPIAAINRIRGILGMTLRPKVLSCPAPELLYPAMVISITELGFPPMRPDDFIDTVLYQWLDACDIVPYAFMKKSELEELAKTYGATEETIKDEKFRREHGLVTTDEIKEAVLSPLIEKELEAEGEAIDEPLENLEEPEEISEPEPGFVPVPEEEITDGLTDEEQNYEAAKADQLEPEQQPHKPTVGELLARLNINNIRKEVDNGSTGCTESDSPQSEPEPGE